MLRYSALDHCVGQHFDHVPAVQPASRTDRQALPCKLINQIQHAHRSSIMRKGTDEIVGPDVIGSLWPQSDTRAVVEQQPPSCLLLLRNLQPFATPDALDPVFAHAPSHPL